MIVYKKADLALIIPCGLGTVVCPDTSHDLQMKMIDSSTVLQDVTPDEGYFGLYRVIVNPYELDSKTVDASTEVQVITSSKDGLFQVIVNPYTLENKTQTITVNGEYSFTPDNADGLSRVDISVNVADTPTVLQAKTVDASTETQVITPDAGYDGLSQVTVDPYTLEDKSDSITENGLYTYYPNAADGMAQVTIDVSVNTVNNQTKTVDSSTTIQYVQPDNGYTGLEYVAVNPYTLDSKTVNPSTNSQTVTSDEDGMSQVTVNPVTAAIDPDIVASNIKKDVDILGVVGTFEGGTLQSKTVDSSTSSQTITPDGANYGLSSVTVNPYTEETVSDTITQNGQYTYTAQNADTLSEVTIDVSVADIPAVIQTKSVTYTQNGEYTVTKDAGYDGMSSVDISVNVAVPQPVMQTKTVDSSTSSQTVTPDQNYDGLSSVTVNPYTLENKTVDSSTTQQTISADNGYDGLNMVTVNPYTLDSKTVDASTVSQTVTSSQDGLSSVTVNPYTTETDSSTLTQNGQYVFTPTNADALSQVTIDVSVNTAPILQSKTVDSSTSQQTVQADQNYDGLSQVIINPYVLDTSTVNPSTNTQVITSNADGLSQVTVLPNSGNRLITLFNYADGYFSTEFAVSGYAKARVSRPKVTSKTVDSSTVSQTFNPNDDSCEYYSGVTVNPYTTETDSSTLTANGQYVFTPQNADALSQVTIDVSVASQGGGDYIYETKTGVRTSLTTDFAGLTDQMYGVYSLFNYCNTLESLTATMAAWGNTPVNKIYMMGRLCTHCENLESVNFPNWTGSTNPTGQFYQAFSFCPKLMSVNFPEMTLAYGFGEAFSGSGDYSADASANFGKLETIGDYGMANCFSNSGFTSINMPLLETVLRSGLSSAFAGPDTSVGSMTFPSLTTCPNANWSASDPSISSAFETAFANNPNITSVSFPELTTVGNQCFVGTFYNATGLTTLSMPKLSTFDKGSFSDAFPFRYSYQDNTANFLYGCTSLVNLTIHPNCLVYGILAGAPNITNLTITDDITDNVRLDWQSSLTSASVLSVLSNLDTSTSGKTVTFYTGGLTVYDYPDGRIQTAYDAATAAGWTIDNLTIIPTTSYLEIVDPSNGTLEISNSSVINFISLSQWTATASGNITLSSGSGNSGYNTITVSVPNNWENIGYVNIKNETDDANIIVNNSSAYTLVNAINSNTDYVDLQTQVTDRNTAFTTEYARTAQTYQSAYYLTADQGTSPGKLCMATNYSGQPYYYAWGGSKNNVHPELSNMATPSNNYGNNKVKVTFGVFDDWYMHIAVNSTDTGVSADVTSSSTGATDNLKLFEKDGDGSFDFYGLKMYTGWSGNDGGSNKTLEHWWLPAYDSSNNRYGVYDLCSYSFNGGYNNRIIIKS